MKHLLGVLSFSAAAWTAFAQSQPAVVLGREVSIASHLEDGAEYKLPASELLAHGKRLFTANWTASEGAGRPLTKGNGKPLADPQSPLSGARVVNRISGPDANSCAGCHNQPYGIPGGSGDFVTGVFVLGQRFDFATFDRSDRLPLRGAVDEMGREVTLQTMANFRVTTGMHGGGYLELLARQITGDLRAIRDRIPPGGSAELVSTGIHFGVLARDGAGQWQTGRVEGLCAASLATDGANDPPSLIIRPWHQAGAVVSLREFTNNAFNHHHGIQSTERFGAGVDADGDRIVNELTRADVTAAALYQASLPVPGRVIPNHPAIEQAVLRGEAVFAAAGCAACHVPKLELRGGAWFTEPNPYNPAGNLRPGDAEPVGINLAELAGPRPLFSPMSKIAVVEAFTDFKLHSLSDGAEDENREALDMQQPPGSVGFAAGNARFLTYRLWDSANQPPYCHHGRFSTMREAVEAHGGEGAASRAAWRALPAADRDAVIEFLKTLQVLPPGVQYRVVDENYQPKAWPPQEGVIGFRSARSN